MIEKIIQLIQEAETKEILYSIDNIQLTGYSGKKVIATLQRLIDLFSQEENTCYLEIGVFQGLTLLHSAITKPNYHCYGIDNFAYFDPQNKNFNLVCERIKNLDLTNVHLLNLDYEDALENLHKHINDQKIGVYFIDGPHDYRSQLMCLQLGLPYLHEKAVILVDDCNYRHVRQANRDFLVTHSDYKLVFEAYTPCHPNNMTHSQKQDAENGWWNGINILVKDVNQRLKPMYPPTERSRQLYENEHLIHSEKLAEFAPEALQHLNLINQIKMFQFLLKSIKLYQKFSKIHNQTKRYINLNTYSENLAKSNYNSFENDN